jgi:leucyl/phenylalanyl-tRNA---protein transferase
VTHLRWLSPSQPDEFPAASEALEEPNGLVALGGDLQPRRLLSAYSRGIFPWYEEGQPILWWSPNPRAVLRPECLRVTRSLRRSIERRGYELTIDTAFDDVVAGCAAPRRYGSSTWITTDMARAYGRLHELGWAHSFEARVDGRLVGGLYGVAIGRVFFGESMFTRATDASKVAFAHAVDFLRSRNFALIDCQVASEHLASLGAECIPRARFLEYLREYCQPLGTPETWSSPDRSAPKNTAG